MSKLVSVWHSDPKWGDPFEGVFYMEPPYTREQLSLHAETKGRDWSKSMAGRGFVMTAPPRLVGPHGFRDPDRHDLSEDRRGHDEYVFIAWYRRDRPQLLTMNQAEERHLLARRYGIMPSLPARGNDPPARIREAATVLADEMSAYRDPGGRDEAGMTAGDRLAMGVA